MMNHHLWYWLQVFSHRLFWVLIVFGGVALAVFLSTSAYLDWQVVFSFFLLVFLYMYLLYLSFCIYSFVFVLVLLVFTSVILKLNIKTYSGDLKKFTSLLCRLTQSSQAWRWVKTLLELFFLFQSIMRAHSPFLKHCQRHNGPKGWVLVTKLTSLGHITRFQTNLDPSSSSS